MQAVPSWQSFAVLAILIAAARLAVHVSWARAATARAPTAGPGSARLLWLACACVLAFALLTAALLGGTAVATLDTWVRAAVDSLYDTAFVGACVFITSFGDTATLVAVTATAAGLLWVGTRRRLALGLIVSALGSQLTTFSLKYAIGRERPVFETFAQASTPAFPSAHATGAVAVYGFVTYAVARQLPPRQRAEAVFWGSVFVALLAASRVVLGVHFLSDVVAGLLVGLAWLALGAYIAHNRRTTTRPER